MLFKNLVVSETAYELLFQESEPVYVYEEGVFGADRNQDRDEQTGYPLWTVRVTASDAQNREQQTLEVRVAWKEKPEAPFQEPVVLPNLRVQAYTRRNERGITTMWFADAFAVAGSVKPAGKPAAAAAPAKAAA